MLVQTAQESARYAAYAPGGFHLPLLPFLQPPTQACFVLLVRLAAWGAVCSLLGVLTRWAVLTVVLSHGYLFLSDVLLFRNHVYLGLLLGLLLALSPCGRGWSVDALLARKLQLTTSGSPAVVTQLIKLQVLIVYGWSVANKLRPSFLDGWTLQQELPHALRSGVVSAFYLGPHGHLLPCLRAWLRNDLAMSVCACMVVATELFLTVGLPNTHLRRYAIAVGVVMHLTIFMLMGIFTFGCLMVASYALFSEARGPSEFARR